MPKKGGERHQHPFTTGWRIARHGPQQQPGWVRSGEADPDVAAVLKEEAIERVPVSTLGRAAATFTIPDPIKVKQVGLMYGQGLGCVCNNRGGKLLALQMFCVPPFSSRITHDKDLAMPQTSGKPKISLAHPPSHGVYSNPVNLNWSYI